ncbi:MAG: thioredoxin domain-containing protein [Sphingorhabdus sp.]|uniref:thioredoxin domain-containing protein n=1 Tax=Sphingorhabdus sp. TaxID=1902408 RepID=UPI0038FD3117
MFRDLITGKAFLMSHTGKYFAILITAGLVFSAGSLAAPAKNNWLLTFNVSDKGAHIVGNPSAPNKIVEYLSYTCSHCADFELKESPQLKAQYVATGKASLEIRNLLLNPIDLTAAMLARCGGKARFFGNQKHLFATQSIWLGQTKNISAATEAQLKSADYVGFMTGVYQEIGLVPIMQQRGISPAQAKTCLADKAALKTILAMTDDGTAAGVQGTPSFMVNGVLQDHVHSFDELKTKLK